MNDPAENPYARAHRLERAKRLTNVIDLYAERHGINPLLEADRVITEVLSLFTDASWVFLTDRAGLKSLPGPETKALVRQTYLDRARLAGKPGDTRYSFADQGRPELRVVR